MNRATNFENSISLTKLGKQQIMMIHSKLISLLGEPTLFYRLMFTHFPGAFGGNEQRLSQGFKLEKWYFPVEGPLVQDAYGHYFTKVGALLQVVFRIEVPSERYHVALLGEIIVFIFVS